MANYSPTLFPKGEHLPEGERPFGLPDGEYLRTGSAFLLMALSPLMTEISKDGSFREDIADDGIAFLNCVLDGLHEAARRLEDELFQLREQVKGAKHDC